MDTNKNIKQGFTLLELLIVIAILAILSAALVLVLNPAESLKKGRDTQRMSDLSTLKTALGLYMTTVSSISLGGSSGICLGSGTTSAKIAYSATMGNCTNVPAKGDDALGAFDTNPCSSSATPSVVNGSGWIPVDFTKISGGSPISNLPLDPTNTVATNTAPTGDPNGPDFVYRYACQGTGDATHPSNVFEVAAILESDAYKGQMTKDGGANANYYEVGTSTKLMGASTGDPYNF